MVTLAADVTQEELEVFLQDTDEQLQLLDEDIIKLENEGDDQTLLQEIFRAAHTIKGSSAMIGYGKMANLTHAMESILDKLRKGSLSVTTGIADALLHSLDALRVLREDITASDDSDIDLTLIIAELEDLSECYVPSQLGDAPDVQADASALFTLDESDKNRLLSSLSRGHKACQIGININKATEWAAVRCFQIVGEMEEKGVIVASNPSQEEIQAEKVDYHLELIYTSLSDEDELREMLNSIPDVENITFETYDVEAVANQAAEIVAEVVSGDSPEKSAPRAKVPSRKKKAASNAQDIAETQTCQAEPVQEEPKQQATDANKGVPQGSLKVSETVRIDVERLDSLMNQVGELVVARTRMNQIGKVLEARYKDDGEVINLGKTFTHITKIVDELQIDITTARMMPVGTVFTRFPRMVRDLAQKANKKIEFVMEGQETGIDRSVIEHIRDPLVHLLRNSVDHGIESPEVRLAANKPEKGTIKLTAAHEQSYIVITVEDDGKGIDGVVVKDAAVRKGILSPEAAARISDADAIYLIFEAGMSTAAKTTEVSGRGVGMDIVRKNIEAFNGVIAIETKVNEGTRFILKLPLTLATFQGLLVTSGSTVFALPLLAIVETIRLEREEIQTISQREVIRLRHSILPLFRLSDILCSENHNEGSIGDNTGRIHVVVIKSGERMVGLAVDSLREPQEVMVKSLGNYIGDVRGIAGASILGSGEVALILDVSSLVKLAVMGE